MELESINYGSLSADDLFFSRHSLLIGVKEGEFSDSSCINLNIIKLYSSLSLLPCTFPIYECTLAMHNKSGPSLALDWPDNQRVMPNHVSY